MTEHEPADRERHLVVATALIGGLLLVLSVQFILLSEWRGDRLMLYLLSTGGIMLFGFGIWQSRRDQLAAARIWRQLAGFIDVEPGQLILLLLAPCFAVVARLAAGDDALALHPVVSASAWATAWVCVLAGAYRRDGQRFGRIARWEILLLLILFGASLYLRAVNAGSMPTTLAGDEGSSGLSALEWLNGRANNLFTMGWFSFPSLFFGLQSVGIALFGRTAEALRWISALGGALTVAAVYLLARTLFDRTTAVIAAVLLACSHFHIQFSRIGLQNIWDGLFAVVALGALWHGWKKDWRGGFLICGVALGLGQYFYASFRIMPLVVAAWALTALIVRPSTFRKQLPNLLLAALTATVIYLPLALYYVDNPVQFFAPLERVTIFDGWLEQAALSTGRSEFQVILEQIRLSALGIAYQPLMSLYQVGQPLLMPGMGALFILGVIIAVLRMNLRYWLLLLPILGVILTASLSMDVPAAQRFVIVVPLALVIAALPLAEVTGWAARVWPRARYGIAAATAVAVVLLVYTDLTFYFDEVHDYYVLGGGNAQVAMELADFFNEQADPPDVYFFGWPRMGLGSIASLPYLAPAASGIDVNETVQAPPSWQLTGETAFIFLPDRLSELEHIRSAYTGGTTKEYVSRAGNSLFYVYTYLP